MDDGDGNNNVNVPNATEPDTKQWFRLKVLCYGTWLQFKT